MRETRIFVNQPLQEGRELVLADAAAHHISRVLRLRSGQPLILFDGRGGEYDAEISKVDKRRVEVHIKQYRQVENESILNITLAQGLSRGQKMDFILQKAVELGVNRIVPVMTEYSNVRLDEERKQKKIDHWHSVIVSACEQCGRNKIPELVAPLTLEEWLCIGGGDTKLVLHPTANKNLAALLKPTGKAILLVGPEGGLSGDEIKQACDAGYQKINLGPRILRTETAGLAAISACQALWGDFI